MNPPSPKIRVLIVEDEGLVSMMIEDMLDLMGYEVAGVAARLEPAMLAVARADFDFALLDVNLGGLVSYPIADALRARRIPFAFSTGYGSAGLAPGYTDVPTLQKPFSYDALAQLLRQGTAGHVQR